MPKIKLPLVSYDYKMIVQARMLIFHYIRLSLSNIVNVCHTFDQNQLKEYLGQDVHDDCIELAPKTYLTGNERDEIQQAFDEFSVKLKIWVKTQDAKELNNFQEGKLKQQVWEFLHNV
jgi:hypothetical protein